MESEAELLRAILSCLPPTPPPPFTPGWWSHEPGPDASLPLRDTLADYLASHGRWPGEPDAEQAGEPDAEQVGGCAHDSPEVIRIADIRLRDLPFRVLRCGACLGRLWACRIPERLFSEDFVLWPLPETEEEILAFVAGFEPTIGLVPAPHEAGSNPDAEPGATTEAVENGQ